MSIKNIYIINNSHVNTVLNTFHNGTSKPVNFTHVLSMSDKATTDTEDMAMAAVAIHGTSSIPRGQSTPERKVRTVKGYNKYVNYEASCDSSNGQARR